MKHFIAVCVLLFATCALAKKDFWVDGTVAATVTAFHPNSSLNLGAIDQQAASLAQSGVGYAFICGTTGESLSLTVQERMSVAEKWRAAATAHGLKLIVHIGTSTPEDSVALAKHAAHIGADAIAAMPPVFFKPATVQVLADVLEMYANAAPALPLYYYHIPSMTGVALDMYQLFDIIATQGRIPTFAGLKFTDNDLMTLARCAAYSHNGRKYNVLFGRDEILLAGRAMGAQGEVGSTYNLPFMAPIYSKMLQALQAGDVPGALTQQMRAVELVNLLHIYGDGALKAMLKMSGLDMGQPRLPMQPLTAEQTQQLKADLIRLHFLDQ